MSASQELEALGGPAAEITVCQLQLHQLLLQRVQELSQQGPVSAETLQKLADTMMHREARTIIGQTMLNTYAKGIEVGRAQGDFLNKNSSSKRPSDP